MYQEHMDLCGAAERKVGVVGADDVRRDEVRRGRRTLRTVFGKVEIRRFLYQRAGTSALSPMDAQLNLSDDGFSFGVRRRIAEETAAGSFEWVVDRLASTTGASVAKRQVEELAQRAAQDFDAFYARRRSDSTTTLLGASSPANDVLPGSAEKDLLLLLSFDAKGIVMVPRDLRPATQAAARRKARKGRKGRPMKRLTRGEKRNRKRMAQVATVYSQQPLVRTAQDVMGELRPVQDIAAPAKRPKPIAKRVWASVTQDCPTVIEEAFQEALARDPNKQRQWVVLVDGNEDQLAWIQCIAQGIEVRITVMLDAIHVLEYFWKAAYCFHGEGTKAAEEWVQHRFLMLLEGHDASAIAAGMTRSATLQHLERREAVDKCADYLCKHRDHLHYHQALTKGMPIATGVIEGACRHLVKDRMDRTGARWSLAGAEAILRLRALHASGDFDAYWAFHTAQEHRRNHASQYAGGVVPSVLSPALRRVK